MSFSALTSLFTIFNLLKGGNIPGKQKTYSEQSIFQDNAIINENQLIGKNSVTLGQSIKTGNIFLLKNPFQFSFPPSLFATGGILAGFSTLFHTGTDTFIGANTFIGVTSLTGLVFVNGKNLDVELAAGKALPAKSFDIKHPSKKGHRLRYVSLEGPEIGVYFRGKLENNSKINIPEYWKNLVHLDSITVSLTPYEYYQELFVEKIEEDGTIVINNNKGEEIKCYYLIHAERKDLEKLIVEYEGKTIEDYPGQEFLNMRDH